MQGRWLAVALVSAMSVAGQTMRPPAEILVGRDALAKKDYVGAKKTFAEYLAAHPDNVEAQLGLADVAFAERHLEQAELEYRKVVALQPQRWTAHKQLVLVEAQLGRWEEFDNERAILRDARRREAPGISARESDLIDAFDVAGQHWIVREYYEPVGRTRARYNFERFSAEGKVQGYVSLESAGAAKAMMSGTEVPAGPTNDFALNWYDGKAHGTVKVYGETEPTYEVLRRDTMRWLRSRATGGAK